VKTETPLATKVRIPFLSPRILSWALFLLVAGAAVLFFVLWRQAAGDRDELEQGRAEVVSTATDFLNALTNFQATTIELDVARIKGFAVGGFADQIDRFFGPSSIEALKKADAKSVGQVQHVFVESLSGSEADVFAVVNQTITNASTTTPKTTVLRIDVGMIDTAAGWKVQRVDILQSPQSSAVPGG
jgi:hypothetical protein